MDQASPAADSRLQRLLEPISEKARAGADAKLSDEFERIQSEVGKVGRAESGEADWAAVVQASESLLSGKSKDLRAATYLAYGWYRLEGVPGLRRGFALLSGLFAGYWDDAFPPVRKTALRADVLTWLNERVHADLGEQLKAQDPAIVAAAWNAYEAFRGEARARFDGAGPSFGLIDDAFAKLPAELRKDIKASEPITPQGAEAPSSGGDGLDGFLAPIAAGAPTGEDPRYTDEFDQLRAEVAKIGGVSGDAIDWAKVASLAQDILSTHSIDLRCLCYWAIARYRLDGAKGLSEGLAALASCAEKYGDELHPKRPKARSGALSWLGDRLEKDLPDHPIVVTAEELKQLTKDVERVQAAIGDHVDFIDGMVIAVNVLRAVRPKAAPSPAPPPPPEAAAAAPPSATASATPTPTAPRPTAPPPTAPTQGTSAFAQQLIAEAQAVAADGETAQSLRMRRMGVWLDPAGSLGGRRRDCDGPDAATRGEIKALFDQKKWPELLARSEAQVVATPYWLDLTVWSLLAAREMMGKEAELALLGEFRALLTRDPDLPRHTDKGGAYLAAADAKAFVAKQLWPAGDAGAKPAGRPAQEKKPEPAPEPAAARGDGDAPPPASPGEPEVTLPAEIVEQFEKKAYAEAMDQASAWITATTGRRARFLRSLALAKRCRALGLNHLAFPLYRALEGQLGEINISEWDPSVAADCLRGYLLSKMALAGLERSDHQLIDRLVTMDPKATMELFRR